MMDYRSTPRHRRPPKGQFPEYRIWRGIQHRCRSPYWQEKGIILAEEWQEFWQFYEDMGPRPSSIHSVDRIDGTKGYAPGNCRWATPKEQAENQPKKRAFYARKVYSSVIDPETGKQRPPTKSVPEYTIWANMRSRCQKKYNISYPLYGGRGIKVCPEWDADFWQFLKDVGPRPSPKHSLDRIDSNKDYEPGNVRWATSHEQANNKRTSQKITWNGESLTASEWSVRTGLSSQVIYTRFFEYGWSIEDTLTKPENLQARNEVNAWSAGIKKGTQGRKGLVLTHQGRSLTLSEWSRELGIDPETIRKRLKAGMTTEEALFKESGKHGLRETGATPRGGESLTYDGETLSIAEWSRRTGIAHNTLKHRWENGWEVEAILTTPVQQRPVYAHEGEQHSLPEWSRKTGIPLPTLQQRLKNGWPFEKAISQPNVIVASTKGIEHLVVRTLHTAKGREIPVVAYDGKEMTLPEWATFLQITPAALQYRIKNGWPPEKLFAP